jgi:hypothetical protein
MKCAACGETFVGTSVERPDPADAAAARSPRPERPETPAAAGAAGPPPPPPAPAASPQPASRKRRGSKAGVLMLIACVFGVVATLALIGTFLYLRMNPTIVIQDVDSGQRQQARQRSAGRRGGPAPADPGASAADEADGGGEELMTVEQMLAQDRPDLLPDSSADDGLDPSPAPPASDPKLIVSEPNVVTVADGSRRLACGTIISHYQRPLKEVTVVARMGEKSGQPVTIPWLPPRGEIRFSAPLPPRHRKGAELSVHARAGRPAGELTVAWMIPEGALGPGKLPRENLDHQATWQGQLRNPGKVPLQNVRVYCDFYFDDGQHRGSASGRLLDMETLGGGEVAAFEVKTTDFSLLQCPVVIVRAVAEKR